MQSVATRKTHRLQVIATTAAIVAAAVLLRVGDPNRGGFPRCPFNAVTGLYCPGCGTQRGLHALLSGDLPAAFGYNAMMVIAVPFLLYVFVRWASNAFDGPRLPRLLAPAALIRIVPVLVIAFTVARNVPFGEALAP